MRRTSAYMCVAVGALVATAAAMSLASADDKKYVVGVSNTLVGNGWREEMVCSIKAEALASGKVSKVILANRNGGPSEQIADLRNLISAGVNIIIVNPSDRKALDPVIKQATDRHIVVVAVDQAVDAPSAYVLTNDQTAYGRARGRGSVQEARRQRQCRGDARHRRRARRRRPPRGLHRGAQEVSRYQGRRIGLHRLVAGQGARRK